MPTDPIPALVTTGLTKRYVSDDQIVVANDRIDLTVAPGSLHAIVGENGAGKSTFAHIVSGRVAPDSGQVDVFGSLLPLANPGASRSAGIGLVAQYFTLVDTLTVWENVVLGEEPGSAGWIDRDLARETVNTLSAALDLRVSPDALVGTLPLPTRRGVEIIKALRENARILILDEPTSVLGPKESIGLFDRIAALRETGTTVILVTHRIAEVIDHATDVTVLRDGSVISTSARRDFDQTRIIEDIIGRSAPVHAERLEQMTSEDSALSLRNVREAEGGRVLLNDASLTVKRGEIVGLAGVAGNGQTELARAIAAPRDLQGGRIRFGDEDVTVWDARRRRNAGLAYIPEDRSRNGLVGTFTVRDNLFLGGHNRFGNTWNWDRQATESAANELMTTFDIRAPSCLTRVDSLSGGNQQKVVLARELSRDPSVIVAVYPTQGLDLGAADFVHRQLREARARGCGILYISNDLDELCELSDRIAVIYEGSIVGVCDMDDYDEQTIGSWMTSGDAE